MNQKSINTQTGSVQMILIISLVVVLTSVLSIFAYDRLRTEDNDPTNDVSSPTNQVESQDLDDSADDPKTSDGILIDKDKYSLTLPNGWETSAVSLFEFGAGAANRDPQNSFVNKITGDYFEVVYKPANSGGGGVDPDYSWSADYVDGSVRLIDTNDTLCEPGPETMCRDRDGRLDVFMIDSDLPSIDGYEFYFYFGNLNSEENVSTQFAKDIIASFRFK